MTTTFDAVVYDTRVALAASPLFACNMGLVQEDDENITKSERSSRAIIQFMIREI